MADELADPSQLSLKLSVNGEVRQKANTRDLIIDVPGLIAFATRFYSLMPGAIELGDRIHSETSYEPAPDTTDLSAYDTSA
jgi:hypothetical protein